MSAALEPRAGTVPPPRPDEPAGNATHREHALGHAVRLAVETWSEQSVPEILQAAAAFEAYLRDGTVPAPTTERPL